MVCCGPVSRNTDVETDGVETDGKASGEALVKVDGI